MFSAVLRHSLSEMKNNTFIPQAMFLNCRVISFKFLSTKTSQQDLFKQRVENNSGEKRVKLVRIWINSRFPNVANSYIRLLAYYFISLHIIFLACFRLFVFVTIICVVFTAKQEFYNFALLLIRNYKCSFLIL